MRRSVGLSLAKCTVTLLMPGMILFTSAGVSCDSNAAASFRESATGPIGDGVKTIVDAVIDGAVAAIKDAGDGSSSSTSTGNGT